MEPDGTGLGVYIAKKAVEAQGGAIWFESKPGVGTTFYFSLPIKL
ncbi:TPA: hybrid sensor histidine kinase/response regulator, partial [Candidatus Azambacteria bacterium]|nr:hybrid sensor histidine kinase/response regulator [Candidatus Azambacteria bacterium]